MTGSGTDLRSGRVGDFDVRSGVGTIVPDRGDPLFFHCTAIADGTRDIPIGARVVFTVGAGRSGRWEASDVAAI